MSDLGRVRSLPRPKTSRNASGEYTFTTKPKILRTFTQRGGYQRISFGKGKNKVAIFVHRLVAQAFIPNPDNLPHVNHKDENPKNNRADNLEWCNAEYNNSYGNHSENCKRHRAVVQMTMDGQEIATFDSIVEAEEKTGCRATSIQNCCVGRFKSSLGYRWKYVGTGAPIGDNSASKRERSQAGLMTAEREQSQGESLKYDVRCKM